MRAVVQRVKKAQVSVDSKIIANINFGLLVFLAVHRDDQEEAIEKLAEKIINLRIFSNQEKKMDLSLKDVGGEILVVSQFTLYGDCQKGNRPSFIQSAGPDKAVLFYEKFIQHFKSREIAVKTGRFGALMQVLLVNDGPVTIILDI